MTVDPVVLSSTLLALGVLWAGCLEDDEEMAELATQEQAIGWDNYQGCPVVQDRTAFECAEEFRKDTRDCQVRWGLCRSQAENRRERRMCRRQRSACERNARSKYLDCD